MEERLRPAFVALFVEVADMTFRLMIAVAAACTAAGLLGGCAETAVITHGAETNGRTSMTVEFPQDVPLRYEVVSTRDIVLDFDPGGRFSRPGSSARQEMQEEARFILSYRNIGRASHGGTIVEVSCEEVSVTRRRIAAGSAQADALQSLADRTFTMNVSATGRLFDTGSLEKVILELGEAAFGNGGGRYEGRRIKNPDMIADFIAVQWYMWDQQQSIERPAAGVAVGQQWPSQRKLLAPMPFVARTGRDAVYTLADLRHTEHGTIATITSTYTLADGPSMDWPIPYTGTFSQRGSFGFFQNYQVLELTGQGEQVFDVTAGRIISYRQQYIARINALMPFGGLGEDGVEPQPNITVTQTITTRLLTAEAVD
ncbi:MAG TPA: hypothetical protein VLH60_00795 [Sedimentisphaerales bacterium]|nr:hypothetical protein [Sedimentisphaerales bacterium]